MLEIFASYPFYTDYVHLPAADAPVSSAIRDNPKRWPYFCDAIGAIDGSHIHAFPPSATRHLYYNRKGFVSQNCLFACNFDLEFIFALTGWEGSATDAWLWDVAHHDGLDLPPGKYLLVDLGFPSSR
jgi:hypothetical protein